MQKLKKTILLVLFAVLSNSFYAHAQWQFADVEWKLKRDRKGIQVFLAKVPGSKYRAVFSTVEIEATTKQLVALVMDLENCPKWASMCKSAEVIERVSPQEMYVYSVNDVPFPVRDRDMVAQVKWRYDPITRRVSMSSKTVVGRRAHKRGVVRVQNASSEWHFIPKGNGKVLVENYTHVDPNGNVPAWLTNFMIVDSPYKTLANMRKLVLVGRYRDAEVAFLPSTAEESS